MLCVAVRLLISRSLERGLNQASCRYACYFFTIGCGLYMLDLTYLEFYNLCPLMIGKAVSSLGSSSTFAVSLCMPVAGTVLSDIA